MVRSLAVFCLTKDLEELGQEVQTLIKYWVIKIYLVILNQQLSLNT